MLTFEERVLYGNPLQRFGSGLEPDPEPTREFGPVANTISDGSDGARPLWRSHSARTEMFFADDNLQLKDEHTTLDL